MSKLTARIFNTQTMSTEDGPGIRTTVFMKGCPMKCIWCQNPEGLSGKVHMFHDALRCIGCGSCQEKCSNGAITLNESGLVFNQSCQHCFTCADVCPALAIRKIGDDILVKDLYNKLIIDNPFYQNSGGGVTFSGGECLIHHKFLKVIIPLLTNDNIHVCIDTSGYSEPHIFQEVIPLAHMVLYDLKIMNDEEHRLYTGVSNRLVLENATWLGKAGLPVWVRIPVIPGYTDSTENFEEISRFLKEKMSPAVKRVDLLGYNDLCSNDYEKMGITYSLKGKPRIKESEMLLLKEIINQSGVETVVTSNYVREGA